jgi:deoxycytidylate deaminase
VSQDNRIIGTGYNGFKPGSVETPDLWDRPTKYEHVVHAEQNAVDFSFDLASKGQVKLYTTLFPCKNCMAILLNYQICEIIYKESYKDTSESMEMALNVGIKVTLL